MKVEKMGAVVGDTLERFTKLMSYLQKIFIGLIFDSSDGTFVKMHVQKMDKKSERNGKKKRT